MIASLISLCAAVSEVPSELRRHFEGLRELDVKVVELQRRLDDDCVAQLAAAAERPPPPTSPAKRHKGARGASPDGAGPSGAAADPDAARAARIDLNMREVVKLSEEKMAMAQQIYDFIDQHIRTLDKDLKSFDADVAKERQKLGLPPAGALGAIAESGGGGAKGGATGQRKRAKGAAAAAAGAAPAAPQGTPSSGDLYAAALAMADPMEPTYCYCKRISFGEMIACEHPECPIEWFHFECVRLTPENRPKGECSGGRRRGVGSAKGRGECVAAFGVWGWGACLLEAAAALP